MNTLSKTVTILAFFVTLTCANLAQAEFFDRRGGMIYDDELDITWLKDANHAMTSGYDDDGFMTWDDASAWAASLTVGTYQDWRLPTFDPFNARPDEPTLSNEIGSLWLQLNGGDNIGTDTDISPFMNLPYQSDPSDPSEWYWTAREGTYADLSDTSKAWRLSINCACWDSKPKTDEYYAWAVRSGDVAANVTIDIKPGSDPNSINLKSKGKIPVAIFTTDTFDATQVDWETVQFGPGRATESHGRAHVEDVDRDGDIDLLLHFNTWETDIQCADTQVTLTGITFAGEVFVGSDSARIVKCR